MSKPEAPVDQLTHYPLPFVPSPDLPPAPPKGDMRYDPQIAGYHHTVFTDSDTSQSDIGVQAAIDSRLQWVWHDDHNRYHWHWGGLGLNFPNTRARQCHTAIFGLTDFVPELGIDFSRRLPRVVRMTREECEQLRPKGQFILGRDGVRVRRFLLEHSFEQGSGAVNPSLIDEFLNLSSTRCKPERVKVLANILLQQTVDPLLTPGICQVYGYMKKHEMLRPGTPSSLGSLIRTEILAAFTPNRFTQVLAGKFSAFRAAAA